MTTMPAPPTAHAGSHPNLEVVTDWAIDLQDVAKSFKGRKGPIHALKGIDMRVPRGSIFGLLGPNGAGKSTLVKILMTVIRPTRCHGSVLGMPVGHKPTLARVGYLPEHHRFPEYLTAEQILDHFGAMALVPREARRQRIQPLLDLVGIGQWSNSRVKGFSKGMRQRLGIANALINEPDLVLLDEPTDGVDPVGRRDIRNVLFELKRQGKTVFLNSHLLSELEMVCDNVAIIVQGSVSAQGTIDELTRRSQRYEIEIDSPTEQTGEPDPTFRTRSSADSASLSALTLQALAPITHSQPIPQLNSPVHTGAYANTPSATSLVTRDSRGGSIPITLDGSTLRVSTSDAAAIQPILDALRAREMVIKSVRPIRESLEDLFMKAVIDPETGLEFKPGAKLEAQNKGGN